MGDTGKSKLPVTATFTATLDANEAMDQLGETAISLMGWLHERSVGQACVFTVANECGYTLKHAGMFAADGSHYINPNGVPEQLEHGSGTVAQVMAWTVEGLGLNPAISGNVYHNFGGTKPYFMFASCVRAVGDHLIAAYCGDIDIYHKFGQHDLVNWISTPDSLPPGLSSENWQCVGPLKQSLDVSWSFGHPTSRIAIHGDMFKPTSEWNYFNAQFKITQGS